MASEAEIKFLRLIEIEKSKGLKKTHFYPGDVSKATVDAFIKENNSIDEALAENRYSPFPDEF